MPELPEVETIARELQPLVRDAVIVDAWLDWPRAVRHPAPDAFLAGLRGRQILGVGRRAKWLLLDLDGGDVDVLVIQVKMTGQVFVVPAGSPRDRYVHFVLWLADGRELWLRDVRKFARLGLYRRDEAGTVLGADPAAALFAGHGPEPLEDAFTLPVFRRRLRSRRGRLKSLLLDQAFIAGIGNIYADEALWRARLHPLRSPATLHPADERRLYLAVRGVLEEAIARRGSSIDDYTAPGGDGEMQEHLDVYQRTGQPCARCGRPIVRLVLGARATHLCTWCQRLPRADHTASNRRLLAASTGRARRGPRWTDLGAGEGIVGSRRRAG